MSEVIDLDTHNASKADLRENEMPDLSDKVVVALAKQDGKILVNVVDKEKVIGAMEVEISVLFQAQQRLLGGDPISLIMPFIKES